MPKRLYKKKLKATKPRKLFDKNCDFSHRMSRRWKIWKNCRKMEKQIRININGTNDSVYGIYVCYIRSQVHTYSTFKRSPRTLINGCDKIQSPIARKNNKNKNNRNWKTFLGTLALAELSYLEMTAWYSLFFVGNWLRKYGNNVLGVLFFCLAELSHIIRV